MEAKLIVVGGKANRAEVKLTLPAVIGRGRDANLTVAHSTVSRRHCLLYEKEGALIVRDNGSLNGTVIEGERITEAVLRPGDTLTVGPLTFRAEYEHFGVFPDLSEKPTLPNVHDTVGDKQGAQLATPREEPATTAVAPAAEAGAFDFLSNKDNETAPEGASADSGSELPAVEEAELPELPAEIGELESSLPELDPPAAEEAPSFGFLSEPDPAPAAENQAVENAASPSEPIVNEAAAEEADEDFAAAPLAEIPADSGEIAGLDFLSEDDAANSAAKDDSPSFGFLGEMDNHAGPGAPESQLPEITLHDSEEPAAAAEDSGEYALSDDPVAPPLSFPVADEPIASHESAEIKNGKHRGAAAATKAPVVDAAKPVVDMDAAALDFLSDEPAGSSAAKSSKSGGKPAQAADSAPEINVGADQKKSAAPEDDELNNFFDSIGLK